MNHKVIGTAVLALGAVLVVLGLALMAILGPDGRFTSGPHPIDADGVAVVTAPTVISWKNVEVEILAEVPASKPVFVGLANSVDVQAYLKGVRRLEVTSFETPWKLKTRQAKGRDALPGAPTAVDWWRANAAGLGGAAIKTRLPDETVSAAILSVGSTNLRGLKVTIAYGLQGAFLKGLALVLAGAGLAWAGVLARRGERLWDTDRVPEDDAWPDDDAPTVIIPRKGKITRIVPARPPANARSGETKPDTEVHEVYVYVDEHGVEHEISAEEAAQYEVVAEVEHEVDDESEPDPTPEPVEGVGSTSSTTEPKPSDDEPVRYFWVDENGVEHEVTEDELHEFELYDEDPSSGSGQAES